MASLQDADEGGWHSESKLVELLKDDGAVVARGQILAWLPEEERYLVETFDGEQHSAPSASLREFHPRPPEQAAGGFDVAFPVGHQDPEAAGAFTSKLYESLARKHYCVVQMSSDPLERRAAVNEAEDAAAWIRLNADFETDFVGRSPNGKKMQWASDEPPEDGSDGGIYNAVTRLNSAGAAVVAISKGLGFVGSEVSNVLMSMKCGEDEESRLLDDLEDDAHKVMSCRDIRDLLAFSSRRRICMMYFVSGSGGMLTLHHENSNDVDVGIPCMENQLLIFQHAHGLLDFTFIPAANQLVMQSWILRDRFESELGCLDNAVPDDIAAVYDKIPDGPVYKDSAETTDIQSMAMRIPCSCWGAEHYWSFLVAGSDGIVTTPIMRWDHDVYYEEDAQPGSGKAYCKHFGMQDMEQMLTFDNVFFGYTDEEVIFIDPGSRSLLECGYEALWRGGWTKNELKGAEIAESIACAENEYHGFVSRGFFGVTEKVREMNMLCSTACRLHYVLGTKGPAGTIDTACSSGLTAVNLVRTSMRPPAVDASRALTKQVHYGLAMSNNQMFDPFGTIACCGASMMTHMGRCFTFNQSGDGYVRAEGQATMYMRQSSREDFSRLNVLCGSAMNQDGRSASMTAPHGPSQQECIRQSLKEGSISPGQIQIQELHGTGTALGDPIEVGSLRATMMFVDGEARSQGLVKTSSKSNIGHTELSAGLCGIMKCVLLGLSASAAPNCHLNVLNPHIDAHGYPVYFTTELVDQGHAAGYNGVSSFGVGGSNARGDVWARAMNGPRSTNPPELGFDLTRARIQRFAEVFGEVQNQTHDMKAVAAAGGLMEYDGEFLTGNPCSEETDIYLEGSFNGWGKGRKMTFNKDRGKYVATITLGDTRVEHFRFNVDNHEDAKIYPTREGTFLRQIRILGPGLAPPGHYWVLDGRDDGAEQGTAYSVMFWYDASTRQKRVHWEPTVDEEALQEAATNSFTHRYWICGSWTVFDPIQMQMVTGGEPGLFAATFMIGLSGHEEFQFLRDGKADEIIYPAHHRATGGDVPVRGPDGRGKSKYFGIVGETGDRVKVQLQVWDGEIIVTTNSVTDGMTIFRSIPGNEGKAFFVVYNMPMADSDGYSMRISHPKPMRHVKREIFELTMTMPDYSGSGQSGALFHILQDEDERQAIHPEMPMAELGASCALGPDGDGSGLQWLLDATPGDSVTIRLDLAAMDKRTMVTWSMSTPTASEEP